MSRKEATPSGREKETSLIKESKSSGRRKETSSERREKRPEKEEGAKEKACRTVKVYSND